MIIFSTLFLSMFITLSLIPIFMRYAVRMNCLDEPCPRKVHCAPVPKVGGIAMALGALLPVALAATVDRSLGAILLGAGIIVVFGAVDDLRELGYRAKFMAQLAAAAVVIFWGGVKICCLGGLAPDGFVLPDWLAVPLTLMVIVGVTNAVNLSDGLDGLAGGIMLMSFLCIGFIAYRNGNALIALLSVATIGAIFGFLRFNTYPATVFMGDAGSQLLGFLAITLATTITQGITPVSPLLPLLLLGMPILDTLTVIAERIRNGKSPFLADKNHLHHKLLRLGLFHTESVFTLYVLQAGLVTTAFFLRFHSEWLLLAVYLGFAASLWGFFWAADKKGWLLERPGLLDASVKTRLKILKDRQVVIKVSENMIELLFPLLLIVTCVLPAGPPVYLPVVAAGLAVAVALIWLFRPPLVGSSLRVVIYFFLPLVIYYAELQPADWIRPEMMRLYHLAFGVLVFFAVLTLKATRRRAGFKLSPLDFIILFVAVLVPNLPDPAIRHFHLGLLAVKIIAIFFVFEVLIGELRDQLKRLGGGIVIALMVLVAKNFLA